MKKYIVTEEQLRVMISNAEFGYASTARRFVESLKPIESLTYEECCTTEVNRNEINFARAIEAHIIGETP